MTDEYQIDGTTHAEKDANGDIVHKPDVVNTNEALLTSVTSLINSTAVASTQFGPLVVSSGTATGFNTLLDVSDTASVQFSYHSKDSSPIIFEGFYKPDDGSFEIRTDQSNGSGQSLETFTGSGKVGVRASNLSNDVEVSGYAIVSG